MLSRLAVTVFFVSCCASAARAQPSGDVCAQRVDLSPVAVSSSDAKAGAAPADVDFGLYPMSVLGIANTLRRYGEAIDGASDRAALTTGPLACVVDALRSWERAYPADPWIPKNLLSLELVYLRANAAGHDLAVSAETWLEHDYPRSDYLEPGRLALGNTGFLASAAVAAAPLAPIAPVTVAPATVASAGVPAAATAPVAASPVAAPFVVSPIALATAAVPPPALLAESFPAIRFPASPWERFVTMDTVHR